MQKKTLILLTLLLASFPGFVHAQWFKFPAFIQRYDIGYSYCSMNATYNGTNQLFNPQTNSYTDTVVKKNIRTKAGAGEAIDLFFPLAKLGRKSMLALNVGFMYNIYAWDNVNTIMTTDGSKPPADDGTNDFTGLTLQMGLPVGLDFKFGNEALIRKNYRFCATLGAGAYPNVTATAFKDDDGAAFGVNPYLKAEGGVLAGVVFKVRAIYTFGNVSLIDKSNSGNASAGLPSTFSLTSKSALTLSILVDPFSWRWKKEGWWD